jgi:hypothetical protein
VEGGGSLLADGGGFLKLLHAAVESITRGQTTCRHAFDLPGKAFEV